MDNFGENREQGGQVKSSRTWLIVAGVIFLVVSLLAVSGLFAWKVGWLSALDPFSGSTPVEISIEPTASSEDSLPMTYQWSYDGRTWQLTMQIPDSLYLYYSRMDRAPVEDYSIYVTHPKDDDELIDPLAAELKRRAVERGYDAEETVNFAASFVQNLTYTLERDEYPKYPVETLVEGGDCEDMAILTAALLQAMGYDAVLIRFSPATEGGTGHMAVGVAMTGVSGGYSYKYEGKTYYYLETTSPWPLGEIPPEYKGRSAGIYKLVPTPALRFTDFTWSVERRWFSSDILDLEVTVTNWGTANADAFYVRAFFEGYESGAKSSATYDLAYGYQISGVVTEGIVVPSGGGTLRVELFQDGTRVDDWSRYIS